MPSLYNLFQRLETEGTPPDSPREERISWTPKAKISQEGKLQTFCLSSTDAEVLKRALANHTTTHKVKYRLQTSETHHPRYGKLTAFEDQLT